MQSACQISAYAHYARTPVLQLKQRTDDFYATHPCGHRQACRTACPPGQSVGPRLSCACVHAYVRVYVHSCVRVRASVCVCACARPWVHACVRVCTYVCACLRACMHARVRVCMCVCACACSRACAHACVCVCACMCVCMRACACVRASTVGAYASTCVQVQACLCICPLWCSRYLGWYSTVVLVLRSRGGPHGIHCLQHSKGYVSVLYGRPRTNLSRVWSVVKSRIEANRRL